MVTKSHRVQIYPNKAQRKLIKRILRACNVIYREMIKAIYEEYDIAYNYAKEHDQEIPKEIESSCLQLLNGILERAEFAGLFSDITKHTLFRPAEIAYNAYTDYIFKHPESYKSYKFEKEAHSFYMDPPESKKWVKKTHVRISMLKNIAASNTKYLKDHTYDQLVGITIKKIKKDYFMTVRIREPDIELSDSRHTNFNFMSEGVTIDLSTGPRFAYVMDRHHNITTIEGFMSDPRIKKYEYKIHLIQSLVNNLKLQHPDSAHIRNMEKSIEQYRLRIKHIKMNCIDNIVYNIVKYSPDYIFMASFCAQYYEKIEPYNHEFPSVIYDRMWDYFFERLMSSAKFHGSDLLVPESVRPFITRCAYCGGVNWYAQYSDVEFRCPHCGIIEVRSKNTLINLSDPYSKETYSLLNGDINTKRYIFPYI